MGTEQPLDPVPAQPLPVAQPLPLEGGPTSDEKTMAMLCHLGGILTGFILPLIIWLIKKDQSRFVDDQGKEALNFQLTLLIAYVVSVPLMFVCIGFFTFTAAWIFALVTEIMGAVAANNGQKYRYPLNIRFIS